MESKLFENFKFNIENTDINKKISGLNWRHRIKINDSFYTPGTRCEFEWDECFLPNDLKGKTFLDVGSNDGMYSFLAERKNASRVVATDFYIDSQNKWEMTGGWEIEKIKTAKEALNSKIEIFSYSIYELDKLKEKFDFVYCGNVLGWLKSHLVALENLSEVCNKTLCIRDDIYEYDSIEPILRYVHNSHSGCYFNGNKQYYINTLTQLGFKTIEFKKVDEKGIFSQVESSFPNVILDAGTEVYNTPWDNKGNIIKESIKARISGLVNDKVYFSSINIAGWVDISKVNNNNANEPKSPYSFIKKILGKKIYSSIERSIKKDKNLTVNYIIIANR